MPDDAKILGFTNRWYARGIEQSKPYQLTDDLVIKILPPELFVATKLEAYKGRGDNDLMLSRDMEDILLVVDGREELVGEIDAADEDIRKYIASQFYDIQQGIDFDHFLEGNIRGPGGRVDIVRERFSRITACDKR